MKRMLPPLRPLTAAEQGLFEAHAGLACREAARVARWLVATSGARYASGRRYRDAWEELIGFAHIGLCKAAQRFDPALGVPFAAYAGHVIRGEVQRGLEVARIYVGPTMKQRKGQGGALLFCDVEALPDPGGAFGRADAWDCRGPDPEGAAFGEGPGHAVRSLLRAALSPREFRCLWAHLVMGESAASVAAREKVTKQYVYMLVGAARKRICTTKQLAEAVVAALAPRSTHATPSGGRVGTPSAALVLGRRRRFRRRGSHG